LDERRLHRGKKTIKFVSEDIDTLLAWARQNETITSSATTRISIGRERMGDSFGRYDGLISNSELRAMLADRYGPDYVWSASALSLFGKSPYKFFAERVLKLEPRIEAALDLAAMDAGGLLHESLRRFFARHRGERLLRTNRLKLRAEMRSVADQVFRERERVVPPLNIHVWKIDREIRQLQLARVIDYEIELQNQDISDGVLPSFFELGFGMDRGTRDEHSTSEFLVMSSGEKGPNGGEKIRLRGQIDRVDISKDRIVIAYDYKLSRGAKLEDMLEGRDLQIAIYLDAIEQLFFPDHETAGGGYYVLRNCDRNRGLYRKASDKYTRLGGRVGSRLNDDDFSGFRASMRTRIWQFVDQIRAGRFVVNPSAPEQTCDICDFADVCRYEKYRILRKTGAR
jgi:ATP-dependent helicase/DNAse subunit B